MLYHQGRLIGRNFIFMQDNDPKHISKLCKTYLENSEKKKVLKNMIWPLQSPDLNPIELLWDELDRKVRNECPTSKNHFWSILREAWNNLSQDD